MKRKKQKQKINKKKNLILRKAYTRKAYTRKGYTNKSATQKRIRLRKTRVKSTKVPAKWIKHRGLTWGKYGEIPIKDDRHLRKFGYQIKKNQSKRHSALKKAAKKFGARWVIHRLVALANIHPREKKFKPIIKKFRNDAKYVHKNILKSKTGRGECPCGK